MKLEVGGVGGWRQLPSSLMCLVINFHNHLWQSEHCVAAKQSNISLWIITPKCETKNSTGFQNKVFDIIHQIINFRPKVTKLHAVKRREPRSGRPLYL